MTLKLLVAPEVNEAWVTVLRELEEAILANCQVEEQPRRLVLLSKAANRLLISANKYGLFQNRQMISLPKSRVVNYLAVLVGPAFHRCTPYFLNSNNNSIYLFDAWPQYHNDIEFYITQLNIRTVFFSVRQATEAFNQRRKGIRSIWMPEGITPENYSFLPYADKNIDVLEFGRKFDLYHNKITAFLQKKGKIHLYEKVKGQVVFPTKKEFTSGLARSKISICFPANITHPAWCGGYSTVTSRYFASMASKCLVLGSAPDEMNALFDYDPIISVDMDNPTGQIEHILEHFDDYIPLIEKNYETTLNHHTWAIRAQEMVKYLFPA